jgi:serine/threonine-protein kinase
MGDPEGTVIGQDPPAGSDLRRGSEVELIVSDGPATVEMIDAIGMRLDEARVVLEDEPYYFEVAVQEVFHDTAPPGQVVLQSIEAGKEIEQGSELTLRVSKGVEQVEVPDLSGLTRAEVEQRLAANDLTGSFTEEYSDTVPNRGEVIEQEIEPGTEIDIDSEVEVVVSAGPLTVEVPDLRGQPVEEARAELAAMDLKVRVIRQPRPRVGPFVRGEEGRVEELSPQPGSTIQRGERIDVYTFDDDAE